MISLIILLWLCGSLVGLGLYARRIGEVKYSDLILSLLSSWGAAITESLLFFVEYMVKHGSKCIWKQK